MSLRWRTGFGGGGDALRFEVFWIQALAETPRVSVRLNTDLH
jgi:hypothetical protein